MNEDGMALPKNGPEVFYHDMDRARAEELSVKLVTHNFSAMSSTSTITHAPLGCPPYPFRVLHPRCSHQLGSAEDYGEECY